MTRHSALFDRATAQVLADFRQDVYVVGGRARASTRLAIVCSLCVLVTLLAFFSWRNEPALRSSTVTYRIDRVDGLPTGTHILRAYCPCSAEVLMWSDFVTWHRFKEPMNSSAVDEYCFTQLQHAAASSNVTNTTSAPGSTAPSRAARVVPLQPIRYRRRNGRRLSPSQVVKPSAPTGPTRLPSTSPSPPPSPIPNPTHPKGRHLSRANSQALRTPPVAARDGAPAAAWLPAAITGQQVAVARGLPSHPQQDASSNVAPAGPQRQQLHGRLLQQATAGPTPAAPQQSLPGQVLQQACSAWVQDIVMSLNPSNFAYKAEAYQAAQLQREESVAMLFRVWLGAKLKSHLQANAAAASSRSALQPLPQFLVAAEAQLSYIFEQVAAEHVVSYPSYVKLCGAPSCDMVARKPVVTYVVNAIAKLGGLWANVLLVALLMWRMCSVLPWLGDRGGPATVQDVVVLK